VTYCQPDGDVRIGREAGAAGVLLVSERLDHDWVVKSALPAGIQRLHVEDINTLHLAQDFQALQSGSLIEIGRDGANGRSGRKEVGVGLDLCEYAS
jgi:hypothetical protein